MSNPPNPKLAAAIRAIWERSFSLVHQEIGAIDLAIAQLQRGSLEEPARAAAEAAAHRLAGSAGTFGFAEASRLAREIEQLLQAPTTDQASRLADLVVSLRMQLLESGGPSGTQSGT